MGDTDNDTDIENDTTIGTSTAPSYQCLAPSIIKRKPKEFLVVVVLGASGDLAKKKIYPALFQLYRSNNLVRKTTATTTTTRMIVWGYARSVYTQESFRSLVQSSIESLSSSSSSSLVSSFLSNCFYHAGGYGDTESFRALQRRIRTVLSDMARAASYTYHQILYFAIPPSLYVETARAITALHGNVHGNGGWTRIVMEKPFGRDLDSFRKLQEQLHSLFRFPNQQQQQQQQQYQPVGLYRIDHYLGKPSVHTLGMLRFVNPWMRRIWDRRTIAAVWIEFKESLTTEGRGGYFDRYGIVRDVIQNHLLQILTLVAASNDDHDDDDDDGPDWVRDSKVSVLKRMAPIRPSDCVVGQYDGYNDGDGDASTRTATYAVVCAYVSNEQWHGVPFLLSAGKALDEGAVRVHLFLKSTSTSPHLPRNRIRLELQPSPSIEVQTNVLASDDVHDNVHDAPTPRVVSRPFLWKLPPKSPSASHEDADTNTDTAYARLLSDVIQGKRQRFVREDELYHSWRILTPLLHRLEDPSESSASASATGGFPLTIYPKYSRGPDDAWKFIQDKVNSAYEHNDDDNINNDYNHNHNPYRIKSAL